MKANKPGPQDMTATPTPPVADSAAGQTLFATAFYHTPGNSPNFRSLSKSSKYHMYYRCMVVCYASIRRNHPDSRLVLFSNLDLPEPFRFQLGGLGVEILLIPGNYVEDTGFSNTFPGCLFTLDVIDYLASHNGLGCDAIIILDNDCVMLQPLTGVLTEIRDEQSFHALEITKPVVHNTNGQSRASVTLAASTLTGRLIPVPLTFYGGEIYAFPSSHLPLLNEHIARFWSYMRETGKAHFDSNLTEEHVVSAALTMAGIPVQKANSWIRRIWTSRYYSSVTGDESKLSIWHLPAEKKSGFARLYKQWEKSGGFEDVPLASFPEMLTDVLQLKVAGPPSRLKLILLRLEQSLKCLIIKDLNT